MTKRAAHLAAATHHIHAANLGALHSGIRRGAKRRKVTMDTSMESKDTSERDEGNQREAFMIPGVDGKLQFGFPTKIITVLRYIDVLGFTSTTGGTSTVVFRMNGPRDPDLTNIGHQPLYWDRWAAVYQSYRVLGSRLTATISGDDLANTQGPWIFGINGSTVGTSLGTSGRNRMEQNDAVSRMYNGQSTPISLSIAYSPEIKLGRPNGDDTVGALVGNDPSVQWYAHVWIQDLNGTTSTAFAKIEIEYTIEFYGLVSPEPES